MKGVSLCVVLLILSVLPGGGTALAQIPNHQCYMCHANPALVKSVTLTSGAVETVPLYVDSLRYATSTHHALRCDQCHTDITLANLFTHAGTSGLVKTYGGWARFSAKNDTVTAGKERSRNYYTAAAMSCNKSGCHGQYAGFDSSTHHTTWRQRQAHVHSVNGESVGEAYTNSDCNRCHTSCATCHFRTAKIQAAAGDVLPMWDSLQTYGDGGSLARVGKMTEYAMDWTVNVASHTFTTGDSLRQSNAVCQSCHIGYYKPPMSGFLSEEAPYPKALGTNIRRHPQVQETAMSQKHSSMKCAQCHSNVHAYPGRQHDWQAEGDVKCQTCHTMSNHYPQHTTVDCISCHFTGFARSKGQAAHDVWRWPDAGNRVRPLVVKYNEAINWYPHSIVRPDPATVCAKMCHYSGNLLAATVISGVAGTPDVPAQFALRQNYPNPFNPSTSISFEVPEATWVRIAVYDVLGRHVATLLNTRSDAGTFAVSWEGNDHTGRPAATGVYVYRMDAGRFTATRKMLLLR